MTVSSPEFYARRVTINDLKYAKQATDMFNEANKPECGGWTSVAHIVKAYGTTVQATKKYIKKSVAGEAIMLIAIKRDAEGNDEAIVGTLAIEDAAPSIDPKLYSFSGNNDEALLGRFAINPKYQSKGLGRLLMDTAIEAMKEKAYMKCLILVFENRDILLNWYKKLGFSDTSVLIPWTMPDQFEMIQDVKFKLLVKDL
ncbi:acyl-CoA N-acyltransferase [Choanephora cucurbitarum]|nr:acyl-CoA N-acyltransferase [Choanephora cucurbitarum]